MKIVGPPVYLGGRPGDTFVCEVWDPQTLSRYWSISVHGYNVWLDPERDDVTKDELLRMAGEVVQVEIAKETLDT